VIRAAASRTGAGLIISPPALASSVLAALVLAGLASTPAFSQAEEHFDQGEFYIEGVRTFCPEVETLVRTRAPELIRAEDNFTIILNGPAFEALPPGLRLFVYYQTCAFMAYGDYGQADVFAARTGMEERWLAATDVEAMCQTDLLIQANWAATPDAARCAAIMQAMRDALR
jgi:hypothetical protein